MLDWPKIGECEVDLAKGASALHEGAAVAELVVIRFGQWLTRCPVPGHAHQCPAVEAPVLHELTGEFHGIPLHVVDASGLGVLDCGEHVLQAMPEFVEEGFHLLKAHEAGGVSRGWGLIADQVGHRQG